MATGSGPRRPGVRSLRGDRDLSVTPVTRLSISLRDIPDKLAGTIAASIREAIESLSVTDPDRKSEALEALSLQVLASALQEGGSTDSSNADPMSRVFADAAEVISYVATVPDVEERPPKRLRS